MIKVGCCGFPRSKVEYTERFPVVEVQQTFYQPPRLSTVKRWREQTAAAFEFTIKAWQLITHEPRSPTYRRLREPVPAESKDRYGAFRPTEEVHVAWKRTREMAEALRARIVLFQCPASFTPTDEHIANMRAFFTRVERGGLIFAWEPRGAWPDETVAALCHELGLIHAVDPFQRWPVTPSPAYFRLHGRTGYRYRYTDEDLECLLEWFRRFDEVYCLFNNVSMWEDGMRMHEACQRLSESLVESEEIHC